MPTRLTAKHECRHPLEIRIRGCMCLMLPSQPHVARKLQQLSTQLIGREVDDVVDGSARADLQYLRNPVLGVHLRGTDKGKYIQTAGSGRQVLPLSAERATRRSASSRLQVVIPLFGRYSQKNTCRMCMRSSRRIGMLLSSSRRTLLPSSTKSRRGGHRAGSIIWCEESSTCAYSLNSNVRIRYQAEALRTESNVAFAGGKRNNHRKGEEARFSQVGSAWRGCSHLEPPQVLLDMLLLSRCDFLLHAASGVAEFAIYFNPKLHHSAHSTRPTSSSHDACCHRRMSSVTFLRHVQTQFTCNTLKGDRCLHGSTPASIALATSSEPDGRSSKGRQSFPDRPSLFSVHTPRTHIILGACDMDIFLRNEPCRYRSAYVAESPQRCHSACLISQHTHQVTVSKVGSFQLSTAHFVREAVLRLIFFGSYPIMHYGNVAMPGESLFLLSFFYCFRSHLTHISHTS